MVPIDFCNSESITNDPLDTCFVLQSLTLSALSAQTPEGVKNGQIRPESGPTGTNGVHPGHPRVRRRRGPRAAPPTRRGRGLTPARPLRGPRSNVTEGVKTAKSDPNPGRTGTNGVNPGHCWVRREPGPEGRASRSPGPRAHACTASPGPWAKHDSGCQNGQLPPLLMSRIHFSLIPPYHTVWP